MNHDDDELERMLEANMTIDDDGFTARVMARLPVKERAAPRILILGIAALFGTGVAAALGWKSIILLCLRAASLQASSFSAAVVIACLVVTLVGAGAQEAWSHR